MLTSPRLVALLALCAVVLAACVAEPAEPPGTATAPPATEPPATPRAAARTVALDLASAPERERAATALERAGYAVTDDADAASVVLADHEVSGADPLVLRTWAAVTNQRSDVLEVEAEDVRAVLTGELTDWEQLGGTPRPVTPMLAERELPLAASALGLDEAALAARVEMVDGADLFARVAEEPGAFTLVPVTDLRPGVLALVVDGYDPYRDAAGKSPLRLERWVRADGAEREAVLGALGWEEADTVFDPVGFVATGETIPVRCTYEQLANRGDFGAMFDGVRDLLQGADLALSQLDAGLTDRKPATPCVSTFALHTHPDVAEAMAGAGIDVVSTATNHHMDCYPDPSGCTPAEVHADTLRHLEEAGLLSVGSGGDAADARQPVFVERDGVRFAFLAYDAIARDWYGASPVTPGTASVGWDTLETLAQDVAQAKAQADHVIVAFSWSYTEYVTLPDDLQRAAAEVIAANGGSLIAGNGPHIVQASEAVGETLVMYALGNFVYDQDWSIPPGEDGLSNYETLDGLIIEAGFTRDRMIGYRLRPTVIRENYRPELVDPAGSEGRRILDRFWSATDRLPPR